MDTLKSIKELFVNEDTLPNTAIGTLGVFVVRYLMKNDSKLAMQWAITYGIYRIMSITSERIPILCPQDRRNAYNLCRFQDPDLYKAILKNAIVLGLAFKAADAIGYAPSHFKGGHTVLSIVGLSALIQFSGITGRQNFIYRDIQTAAFIAF